VRVDRAVSVVCVGFARLEGANWRRGDEERPFVPIMRCGCCYACVCARGVRCELASSTGDGRRVHERARESDTS